MFDNPENLLSDIDGLGYTSISTINGGATWDCSLLVSCDGQECNYYGTGATIYWAIHAASEEAKKAQAQRAKWYTYDA